MASEGGYNPERYARTAEVSEDDALLPSLTTTYAAVGRFSNKTVASLAVIFGSPGFVPGGIAYVAIQYIHLGTGEFGFTPDGQMFRFPIADLQPFWLTVHGRNLLKTFDGIRLHRVPWIRQRDRDFRSADAALSTEPVITRIEVSDWKPAKKQALELATGLDGEMS